MKQLYLVLSLLGGIIPYLFFFNFIAMEGVNLPLFAKSLFVNGAAGGFSIDLLISSFVFWIFMFREARDSKSTKPGPKPFWFIVINLTIGLSAALPAYLYVRESIKEK